MARWMRDRWSVLALSVLATGVAMAGDVTVKQGEVSATSLNVTGNASVGGMASITGDVTMSSNLDVGEDLTVDDDIDCWGVGYNSWPYGFFGQVYADDMDVSGDTFVDGWLGGSSAIGLFDVLVVGDALGCALADCALGFTEVCDDAWFYGDTLFYGKIDAQGGIDPPYILYDVQTREEIVERVKREVPPEKQSGAVIFFNGETKVLESYTPREGKFCDLHGNVVHTIPPAGSGPYETFYYIDGLTGQLKTAQRTVRNRYAVKHGYKLDEKTGQFTNTTTGAIVPREEAVALYVADRAKHSAPQGNPMGAVRDPRAQAKYEVVTEYHFDAFTGEVTARERRVYDRFVIKKGYGFDKRTGQFVKKDTGEVVPKETAVELKRASSAAE